jgi:hypothetical protein
MGDGAGSWEAAVSPGQWRISWAVLSTTARRIPALREEILLNPAEPIERHVDNIFSNLFT